MVDQVQVRRPGSGGRWWWQKPEYRTVPTHYRPFTRAYNAGFAAKEALWIVAPHLYLPAATAYELINTALWDAAGASLMYLQARREEWELSTAAQALPPDHRLRIAGERRSEGMRRHAEFLDAEATGACRLIETVCSHIADVGALIRAEDGAREALIHADRRGAYSTWVPDRTVDLSERVAGLSEGLRQMAVVGSG